MTHDITRDLLDELCAGVDTIEVGIIAQVDGLIPESSAASLLLSPIPSRMLRRCSPTAFQRSASGGLRSSSIGALSHPGRCDVNGLNRPESVTDPVTHPCDSPVQNPFLSDMAPMDMQSRSITLQCGPIGNPTEADVGLPVHPENLRWAREVAGFSKADLARHAAVAPSLISMLEGGQRSTATPAVLKRISSVLGCPLPLIADVTHEVRR